MSTNESFIEREPKVFVEGKFATTIECAKLAATQLFDNGVFFDFTSSPEIEDIEVNPDGRGGYGNIVIEEEVEDSEDSNITEVSVVFTSNAPQYVQAKRLDYAQTGKDFEVEVGCSEEEALTVQLELFAVDETVLDGDLEFILRGVLAAGYMAGRRDQISDMFGSNETRFVKAEDLMGVVERASSSTHPEYGFFSKFSGNPAKTIVALKSLRGVLKDSGIVKPDLALDELEDVKEIRRQLKELGVIE